MYYHFRRCIDRSVYTRQKFSTRLINNQLSVMHLKLVYCTVREKKKYSNIAHKQYVQALRLPMKIRNNIALSAELICCFHAQLTYCQRIITAMLDTVWPISTLISSLVRYNVVDLVRSILFMSCNMLCHNILSLCFMKRRSLVLHK